jgi:hypothetical protein
VVLKEGVIEDAGQKTRIAKLLRFHSTSGTGEAPEVTLDAYVARMKTDQKSIYYLTADNLLAARNSPHLEGFGASGFEVLLLTDRIDEWVVSHLHEFEGKTLANVASAAADVASAIETPEKAAAESTYKDTLERLGKALTGKIASARVSGRLTDSPAVLVAGEFGVSLRMTRILKQAGQNNPFATLPILELNPKHALVERLRETADEAAFGELAHVLYDQAMLAEGGDLDDPAIFVKRVNKLIVEGLAASPKIILTTPATARIIPRAGIVDTKVVATHVAVARLLPVAVLDGGRNTRFASTAIHEVMRQLFAGDHTRAYRETGSQAARDTRTDSATTHRRATHVAATAVAGRAIGSRATAHDRRTTARIDDRRVTAPEQHPQ